jgi:5-methylcytosine-specific restriction endonuclease McrA
MRPGDALHVDHYLPLALGGSNAASNLRLMHATCNLAKGAA